MKFTNNSFKPLAIIDFQMLRNTELSVSYQAKPLEKYYTSNRIIHYYKLPQPLQAGSSIVLYIKFTCSQIDLSGDGVYDSDLWIPHLYWNGVPHVCDYKVKMDIPKGYAVAVSGKKNPDSGYYEGEGVSNFGIYLGKGLQDKNIDVDDVRITALFTEEMAEGSNYCLKTAVDVVPFYKEWLGFYPFDFLYILPGGSGVWGGYPMATGMVRIHGLQKFSTAPALHWKWITAHEIGHQYWGGYVLDGDKPPWLWIGLGVYADREYTLAKNIGSEKQVGMMQRFIHALKNNYNTTIDVTVEELRKADFNYNSMIRHGKGFSFISALELTLGKDMFQQAYKRILSMYGGKRLDWQDFQKICEEESGENLNWFFQQWVRADKYLYYTVTSRNTYKQGNKWISEITVERKGTLSMPIPVQAVFEDGSSQVKFTERVKDTNILMFESNSRLWSEVIDPEQRLPMLTEPLPPPEAPAAELVVGLPSTGAGAEALRIYQAALTQKMTDASAWFHLGMILFDGGYYEVAYNSFENTIESDPEYIFVASTWMGMMQDLMGNREKALQHYKNALENDDGSEIRHDQFGLLINRNWVEKLMKEAFTW